MSEIIPSIHRAALNILHLAPGTWNLEP